MPRGNGMGPNGMGSMTGRQMGRCAGYNQPGFMNAGGGFGRGIRRGNFNGYQNMPMNYRYTNTKEAAEDEVSYLEEQLKAAKARFSSFNE